MEMLKIQTQQGYKSLVTGRSFQRGEIIGELPCTAVHTHPSQYTIQTGGGRHIEIGTYAFMNHSCSPNVIINTTKMQVIANQSIQAGSELTFFYPSTEWEMVNPFICLCGSPSCIHVVAGAKFLSFSMLANYYINQHIRDYILEILTQTDGSLFP